MRGKGLCDESAHCWWRTHVTATEGLRLKSIADSRGIYLSDVDLHKKLKEGKPSVDWWMLCDEKKRKTVIAVQIFFQFCGATRPLFYTKVSSNVLFNSCWHHFSVVIFSFLFCPPNWLHSSNFASPKLTIKPHAAASPDGDGQKVMRAEGWRRYLNWGENWAPMWSHSLRLEEKPKTLSVMRGWQWRRLVVERDVHWFLWEEDTSACQEPLTASWEPSIIQRDQQFLQIDL